MKKFVFTKNCFNHRKTASTRMVWMKMSYQKDPIAVIFVVVAWPEEAYETDFYKKCPILRKNVIVPVPG